MDKRKAGFKNRAQTTHMGGKTFHTTPKGKKANKVTQKEADMLFSEGLSVDQVRWSKARVMYGGVTIFQRVKYMFKREKY